MIVNAAEYSIIAQNHPKELLTSLLNCVSRLTPCVIVNTYLAMPSRARPGAPRRETGLAGLRLSSKRLRSQPLHLSLLGGAPRRESGLAQIKKAQT